jgi:hypothetical protein
MVRVGLGMGLVGSSSLYGRFVGRAVYCFVLGMYCFALAMYCFALTGDRWTACAKLTMDFDMTIW